LGFVLFREEKLSKFWKKIIESMDKTFLQHNKRGIEMTEPKTLKDIGVEEKEYTIKSGEDVVKQCVEIGLDILERYRKNIRQEVVKWIKKLNKLQDFMENEEFEEMLKLPEDLKLSTASGIRNRNLGMIIWIKYFFNITEEELK